jgi:hypothetical protein
MPAPWLTALPAVERLLRALFGNREARDAAIHDEQQSAREELAAEFVSPSREHGYDAAIDALNRLPRPLMVFAVFGLFIYAPYDPASFVVLMQAYALVPEWLAAAAIAIIAFYFGSRHLEKRIVMRGPSEGQIKAAAELVEAKAELKRARTSTRGGDGEPRLPPPRLSDEAFESAMEDETTPLSDAAIEEWNRRRGE